MTVTRIKHNFTSIGNGNYWIDADSSTIRCTQKNKNGSRTTPTELQEELCWTAAKTNNHSAIPRLAAPRLAARSASRSSKRTATATFLIHISRFHDRWISSGVETVSTPQPLEIHPLRWKSIHSCSLKMRRLHHDNSNNNRRLHDKKLLVVNSYLSVSTTILRSCCCKWISSRTAWRRSALHNRWRSIQPIRWRSIHSQTPLPNTCSLKVPDRLHDKNLLLVAIHSYLSVPPPHTQELLLPSIPAT